MGVCQGPACAGTSRLSLNLGNERKSWRATSSEVLKMLSLCKNNISEVPLDLWGICRFSRTDHQVACSHTQRVS